MSLISEALKKARQEAARQDALHQGAPYAVGAADARPHRNPLLPVLAGLGAGCLFAGLLFAVAWGAGWGPFAKPSAPAPVPAAEIAQAAAPASPPPAVEVHEEPPIPPARAETPPPRETPAPAPRPEPAPPAPAPQTAVPETPVPQAEPILPPVAAPVETTPAVEPEPSPEPAAPAPAPPAAPAGGLEDGKVYSGEVPIPGGGSVKLNGIAYGQERPVAVLDGRVMGPGEAIQGFTVIAIEAGRVKLQGYGATVYLSPR